jgi:hypothetical protein
MPPEGASRTHELGGASRLSCFQKSVALDLQNPDWTEQQAPSGTDDENRSACCETLQPLTAAPKREAIDLGVAALSHYFLSDLPRSWAEKRPNQGDTRKSSSNGTGVKEYEMSSKLSKTYRLRWLGLLAALCITTQASAQQGWVGPGQSVTPYGTIGDGYQPLFHNYFVRGASNQATAGLYISPRPVPGWVGHTYNTYQPFWPHEFLYQHKDTYHSYYDQGRGLNRTSAHYYAPPVHTAVRRTFRFFELPR